MALRWDGPQGGRVPVDENEATCAPRGIGGQVAEELHSSGGPLDFSNMARPCTGNHEMGGCCFAVQRLSQARSEQAATSYQITWCHRQK